MGRGVPLSCPCLHEKRFQVRIPVIVNRLTVDGRDYFLPDPVVELKGLILSAIRAGGGYVNIPPLKSGTGVDILFSPGMPVLWTQLDVGGDPGSSDGQAQNTTHTDIELGVDLESSF
jgi:hypothetical protein